MHTGRISYLVNSVVAPRMTYNRQKAPTYCEGGEAVKGVLLLRFATRDDARGAEILFDHVNLYVFFHRLRAQLRAFTRENIGVRVYSLGARDQVYVCGRMSKDNKFSFIVRIVETKEIPIWKGSWSLPD